MQTPQKMLVDEFVNAMMRFYREHATDPTLAFRATYLSIHDERFAGQCVGMGRVWRIAIPYCEGLEREPEESGCIHVPHPLLDVGVTLEATRGVENGTKMAVRLTHHEHMALINVLLEQLRAPESTLQFVDVLTDRTVTVSDLLAIVSTARTDP
jgi:hypothetical protein